MHVYKIVKRNYPGLRVRVINCEIMVVIYTFFRVLGNEKYKKKCAEEKAEPLCCYSATK